MDQMANRTSHINTIRAAVVSFVQEQETPRTHQQRNFQQACIISRIAGLFFQNDELAACIAVSPLYRELVPNIG
jgi:hypothetical protein